MKEDGNKGFSLIELIVVITIMAVLIGVLAPQYIRYVEKSRVAVDEDMADSLLGIGCLIAADEDYFLDVGIGDQIIYTRSGILLNPAGNPTLSSAMDEFADSWRNRKVKSKTYSSQKYVVEFQGGASGSAFNVVGNWQPNP